MLARMLHGKIPAPRGVKNKQRRAALKFCVTANKMEDFAPFFLHVNEGNFVNAAPVAALPAALRIKDGPVKKHREVAVFLPEFQDVRGKRPA
jgi:hypothetical protein